MYYEFILDPITNPVAAWSNTKPDSVGLNEAAHVLIGKKMFEFNYFYTSKDYSEKAQAHVDFEDWKTSFGHKGTTVSFQVRDGLSKGIQAEVKAKSQKWKGISIWGVGNLGSDDHSPSKRTITDEAGGYISIAPLKVKPKQSRRRTTGLGNFV